MAQPKMYRKDSAARREELRPLPGEHEISTVDVAALFGVSIPAAREYKRLGIVAPVGTEGMADIYRLGDVRKDVERKKELRLQGLTLARCGEQMRRERGR
jgi:hypothetical protein